MTRKSLFVTLGVVAVVAVGLAAGRLWLRSRGIRVGQFLSSGAPMDARPAAEPPPAGGVASTPRAEVSIDPRRQQLIGVRTVAAMREDLSTTIRAVGVVRSDETRLTDVNVKVDGWIKELFVDFTGQPVKKGQPLFTLYSPDLLNTEQEYVLARKAREQLRASPIADARERADALVAAARQRLELWDLTPAQLDALDQGGAPDAAVTFRSPVDGIVTEKSLLKGAHITAGQMLYKIADLSVVWIEADVYEQEMPMVKTGGRAVVTLDAYPGERFTGRVIYISQYVDEKTRTNKVRYEFANRGGRLKPGMFANVEIAASGGSGVTVPADAVLDSGVEQLVFVAKGDGVFEPRKVKIGRRLGERTQILEGVTDGEAVAMGATFLLDSESQLRASLQGFEAAPAGAMPPASAPAQQLDIVVRTVPDPPQTGENQFEVVVKDAAGKPIPDADVSMQFFMAAMPTMSMPAMRNEVKLSGAGAGVYRGAGQIMMAGRWDATVTVVRGGQRLGSKQLPVTAR
jgi:RND family efflux transporter MFP subunit